MVRKDLDRLKKSMCCFRDQGVCEETRKRNGNVCEVREAAYEDRRVARRGRPREQRRDERAAEKERERESKKRQREAKEAEQVREDVPPEGPAKGEREPLLLPTMPTASEGGEAREHIEIVAQETQAGRDPLHARRVEHYR